MMAQANPSSKLVAHTNFDIAKIENGLIWDRIIQRIDGDIWSKMDPNSASHAYICHTQSNNWYACNLVVIQYIQLIQVTYI